METQMAGKSRLIIPFAEINHLAPREVMGAARALRLEAKAMTAGTARGGKGACPMMTRYVIACVVGLLLAAAGVALLALLALLAWEPAGRAAGLAPEIRAQRKVW
jgi:hypothetical protein